MSSGTADSGLLASPCAGAVMVVPDAVIARPKERVTAAIASRSVSRLQVASDEVDMVLVASAQYLAVRVVQIFGVSLLQVILGVFLGATGPWRRLAAVLSAPFRIRSIRERRKQLRQLRLVSKQRSLIALPDNDRLTAIVKIRDDGDAVAGDAGGQARDKLTVRPWPGFSLLWGYSLAQESSFAQVCPVLGLALKHRKLGELLRLWWDPWDSRGVGLMMATAGGVVVLGVLSAAPSSAHYSLAGGLSRSRPSWASRTSATGWCPSDGAASGCCAGDLRGRANRAVNAGCR